MKDIREGIAKIYYQYSMCGIPDEYELEWANETECTKQACYAFTDYILTYLKANGLVRLAENQEVPDFNKCDVDWCCSVICHMNEANNIIQANFKRVEELI